MATQAVATYRFEDRHPLRVLGQGQDELWFVAKDVCDALGLANTAMAVAGLDDDEKALNRIDTRGGEQGMIVVSEAGLYALIMRSNRPEARPFRRWVAHEVLPAIRRTGSYSVQPLSPAEQILASAQVLVRQEREIAALRGAVEHQGERIERAVDAAEHAFRRSESNHGHFSVLAYCIRTGRELDVQTAARHGKELTRLCKGLGIPVAQVADPRFGRINTYPERVLQEHFGDVPKAGDCS